jgi:arsenical pump membrane protein
MQLVLLVAASALMLLRPWRIPLWAGPAVCASIGLATTAIPTGVARSSLATLGNPLLFVGLAVPLAVTLDDIGVFAAIAAEFGGGRHLVAKLWWLAAGVVAVFNLDAAVVLLTPLYVRIARRQGLPAEALAFQPALLACLGSGVLPVSNLTNLIVAERFGLGIGDFLANLAVPSIAATAVGYLFYRSVFHLSLTGTSSVESPGDRGALVRGVPVIAFVLFGMTVGAAFGVPAWVVAAMALIWATALNGRLRWRTVPVSAIVIAGSLAVLVAAAAPHLGVDGLFARSGLVGVLGVVAFGALGSNAANNLPVVLAGSTAMTNASQAWPLLIGANIGSVFLVTASLSGLIWRDTAKRAGVTVSGRRYASVGLRVGLPALAVATLIILA